MKSVADTQGFTLIELLIVLVILSLSVSIVAPNMFNIVERIQKQNEVKAVDGIVNLIKEVSFFSSSHYLLVSQNNQITVFNFDTEDESLLAKEIEDLCKQKNGITNEDTIKFEEQVIDAFSCKISRTIESKFYTFPKNVFMIVSGNLQSPQSILFYETDESVAHTLKFN